jgi:DNA-directed RNA polymerase subunit D
MISEVPSMAIEDVFIYENSSTMHDEVLAHRLGLIPLKTDLNSYVLPEKCECKSEMGCNKCRAIATLDVEAKGMVRTVYSGDLKFDDPAIAPVSDRIPIIKLVPGQKLKLEAHAKLGIAKNHAKWQPVSACAYKYMPIIKINSKTCDVCGKCVTACPKKVLRIENEKIEVKYLLKCNLCKECFKACPKKPSAITVEYDETTFIFYVESTGCLPVEKILIEASKVLGEKVDELAVGIKSLGGK